MLETLDTAFKEITKKIGKIEIYSTDTARFNEEDSKSLIINTIGVYKFTLVLYSELNVLHTITKNMKRGKPVEPPEIPIYTKEYFNIFCGRAITVINNATKSSLRFSVPNFIDGVYLDDVTHENLDIDELYYKSDYGNMKLQIIKQI